MNTKTFKIFFISLLIVFIWVQVDASDIVRVIRVVDGDTIVIDLNGTQEKVRFIGVDTPETVDPRKPVQFFGKEASAFTKKMLNGKQVRLEYDWNKRGKYGRLLAYVYLNDGTFFNAKLIQEGYAHAYTRFPFKFLEEFRKYERQARENNKGLWGSSGITATSTSNQKITEGPQENIEGTVYITSTGKKYHKENCKFLKSKISISKIEATSKGYTACKVCKP